MYLKYYASFTALYQHGVLLASVRLPQLAWVNQSCHLQGYMPQCNSLSPLLPCWGKFFLQTQRKKISEKVIHLMLLRGKWIDYCALAFELMWLAPLREDKDLEGLLL